ncbi:hypothetical protein QBC40DRAFT_326800 [Triangularia verruculosa]|uniref:SMP-30/Gluconolactonase/LRE-like region domain-containing protein n=1 Tax=Triangularia verruculosa TaxID=2587418 RepID=A0AAN6XH17_9PEZI|nr:hypothetical protein QBC40DRAFT_326800 [Triangularia verruculosa]
MSTENFQVWEVKTPYLNLHCGLGEGPYYEPATQTVRFVDIKNKKLHTVSINDPTDLTTLTFNEPVTVTADVEGLDPTDKILIGAKQGLAILDRKTGEYLYISKIEGEGLDRIRSNDGAVDPQGRFWMGSMTDFGKGDFRPEGSLFQFSQSQPPKVALTSLTIPNSVGWSPDHKTMYFTHSNAREVIAWDYDPSPASGDTLTLSNKRVFYQHVGKGEPDGFRVDVEGNIWHAVYGESRVLKLSPEGKLIGEIRLPTRNITCVEFVGEELFITTAGDDDAADGEESKELGGGLFRVHVGVTGVGHDLFKL